MSAKGDTAVPPGYTRRGKKLHKPKPNPPIELPDGDTAQPVAVLVKKFGMTVRSFEKLGVPLTRKRRRRR
jgi:hypothetical protein